MYNGEQSEKNIFIHLKKGKSVLGKPPASGSREIRSYNSAQVWQKQLSKRPSYRE